MDDPSKHGRQPLQPPSMPPSPPGTPPPAHGGEHLNGNLSLMLGRLIGQGEHIIYRMGVQDHQIAWIKDRLADGSDLFHRHGDRMDAIETEMRRLPEARLAAFLGRIATPREWAIAVFLAVLFLNGIIAPEFIRDLLTKWTK